MIVGQNPKQTRDGKFVNRTFAVYPITSTITANTVANRLWDARDELPALFEHVAQWLTARMRDAASGRDTRDPNTVHGTAVNSVLYIRIRWGFFALLAGTVAGGCAYVLGVLAQTCRLGLPLWKESAYPTLAFAPGETATRDLLHQSVADDGPRAVRRAKVTMVVGLQDTDDGYYKLSRTEGGTSNV